MSGNILSKIKNGAYLINLDEYKSVGTHLGYDNGIQANDSIRYGYFCHGFIEFKLKGKNSFSPNKYEKNDKTKLKYFQKLKILR